MDASAVVDLLLGTERAAGIAQVLDSVTEAHAPELIDPEVIAVVRRWTLRGWLPVEAGGRAVEELGQLAIVRHRQGATSSGLGASAPVLGLRRLLRGPGRDARCRAADNGHPAGTDRVRTGRRHSHVLTLQGHGRGLPAAGLWDATFDLRATSANGRATLAARPVARHNYHRSGSKLTPAQGHHRCACAQSKARTHRAST